MAIYNIICLLTLGLVCTIQLSQQFFFDTKCLGKYGCFYNGPPFYHLILRPISLLPFDLKDFNTKFYLYTSSKDRAVLDLTKESLEKSGYDASLGLRVFVHGFQMQFDEKILAATERFLGGVMKAEPKNTILVDWSATNRDPYPQAVANGRVVGAQITELIQFIMNSTGLDPKDVHIIGHSLGAHVSGWVGERIKNIGRITGLDPAGPYFQYSERKVRLDTTDAIFVDIIHSNAGDIVLEGLGIVEPIGHIDFYPNGGTRQPGCDQTLVNVSVAGIDFTLTGTDLIGVGDLLSLVCNHVRSLDFFLDSATSPNCQFIGYQCPDYDKFKWNRCKSNQKAVMGLFATQDESIRPGSRFFLTTESAEPYCKTE